MENINIKLKENIKNKLAECSMSVSELERRAGLKQSTIHNILHGRSKNPSIETVKYIAEQLNCSIEELIGDNNTFLSQTEYVTTQAANNDTADIWDAVLFIKAIEAVQAILDKRQLKIPKRQALACIEEVYKYSQGISTEVDKRFAEWIINKILPG